MSFINAYETLVLLLTSYNCKHYFLAVYGWIKFNRPSRLTRHPIPPPLSSFCVQLMFADVQWQNQKCRIVLHYENGFTLVDSTRSGVQSSKQAILWNHPFERLRMSADDGSRLVWLDFGEDGEQVWKFTFHFYTSELRSFGKCILWVSSGIQSWTLYIEMKVIKCITGIMIAVHFCN